MLSAGLTNKNGGPGEVAQCVRTLATKLNVEFNP